MRKAGFTTTLVVDAPGWGQNIRPVLEGGRQLIRLYGNLRYEENTIIMPGSYDVYAECLSAEATDRDN